MANVETTLIQQRLIAKAIEEPSFYKKIKDLDVDLFEGNIQLGKVYQVVKDYYLENGDITPSLDALTLYATKKLDRGNNDTSAYIEMNNTLKGVYVVESEDQKVFDEQISAYIKRLRLTTSLKSLLGNDLSEEAITKFEKDFDVIRNESANTGLHEIVDFMNPDNKEYIADKIRGIDLNTLAIPNNEGFSKALGGGLAKGEMGAISASSGTGKTMNMVSLAMAYISGGYNVMYIALEELEERMYSRFFKAYIGYAQKLIPGINPEDLIKGNDMMAGLYQNGFFESLVNTMSQESGVQQGNLTFTRYSPHTLTVDGLRQVIHDNIVTRGNPVDVIIVDYPDLLSYDTRNGESEAGGKLYEELRAIGQENNVVMWVASQLNRGAGIEGIKTGSSIEGSYRKRNSLELSLVVNSTSAEYEAGFTRMYVDKSRNGGNTGEMIHFKVEPYTKVVRGETPEEASQHANILQTRTGEATALSSYETKEKKAEDFKTRVNKSMGGY